MRARVLTLLAGGLAALALAACGSSSTSSSTAPAATSASATTSAAASTTTTAVTTATATQGEMGYEGVPLEVGPTLGAAATTRPGTTVDGIKCGAIEQLAYHIHIHFAVFDNGVLQSLPAGIGIPGSTAEQSTEGPVAVGAKCFYWLHTHTSDGIIHVESPTARIYTLGDFFAEWRQPLSGDQVASVHGQITAYFNGHRWTKALTAIPLLPHALIQLDIGNPIPPLLTVDWAKTQL